MSVEVRLPKLGFSMTEGRLTEWLIADGATVTEGAPLYALELDKSAQEIEAPAAGQLRIVAATGEVYAVGTVLAYIE